MWLLEDSDNESKRVGDELARDVQNYSKYIFTAEL